jgi:CRP/FNR family transcriptional activator FtrB
MTVRVSHDARLLVLPAETFRAHLATETDLALAAARLLAGYWRRLVQQIKDLKLRSGPQRLAGYLLGLAAGAPGPVVVELPGDRKLVAARLGMTPESLSRAFLALRAVGVGGAGRRVRLEDPDRLRAFAQDDGLA